MIFAATFSAVAVSAAQDLFEIVAPAGSWVTIREIRVGQYSDSGDAAAEALGISILRGYTTSGSGGSTATPVAITNPQTNARSADSTVEVNNTTVAADGSPVICLADAFNIAAGWHYYPVPEERIKVKPSQRLVVRLTAPADALTMNGTIVFEEHGLQIPA